MDEDVMDKVYPDNIKKEIESLVDIKQKPMTSKEVEENLDVLKYIDVIFSSWGGPNLNENFLNHAPNLKIMFYGAGTIKKIVTDESWKRGIRVTTANAANAIPVAEFTIASIIFGLKNVVQMKNLIKDTREYPSIPHQNIKGVFDSTVGIISLGAIGSEVLKRLKNFDVNIMVYHPSLTKEEAKELGVEFVSLDEMFKTCDVVTLHAPLLDSTRGMITGDHIKLMKENGVFINTARGAIVKENELIEVLKERKDITAFLDVVYPEPPAEDSPLYDMDNVFLTPHIAGSEGKEIGRMGKFMLEELKRYLNGESLKWEVTKEKYEKMA